MYYLFIYLLAFLALVDGHAVLQNPLPYNTNPSKTSPCGVNAVTTTMRSTPLATWTAGEAVTLTWNLQIGDGAGLVYGLIDPRGGNNYSVKLWDTPFDTKTVKFYSRNFVVPENLNCEQSPTGYCTVQVYVDSNWFSCTTVAVIPKGCTGPECDAPPPPPQTCQATRGNAPFCSNVTNALIQGGSVTDKNAELVSTYDFNRNNPDVFSNGNSAACMTSYRQLLCSLNLQSCNATTGRVIASSQACRSQCKQTMEACGIVKEHVPLYPCDKYPLCPGEKDAVNSKAGGSGGSGGMTPGGKAALSLFFIGTFAAAAFAGYTYNKQGHLMGYKWDKNASKFVKRDVNPHNYTAYEDKL